MHCRATISRSPLNVQPIMAAEMNSRETVKRREREMLEHYAKIEIQNKNVVKGGKKKGQGVQKDYKALLG